MVRGSVIRIVESLDYKPARLATSILCPAFP